MVVLDALHTDTVERAEVALPAATFAESDGSLVNSEGRAQRFFQVFVPHGDVQASWQWLGELQPPAGLAPSTPWANFDELLAELASALPVFAAVALNRPAGRLPHHRPADSAPAGALQRAHRHHRERQCA